MSYMPDCEWKRCKPCTTCNGTGRGQIQGRGFKGRGGGWMVSCPSCWGTGNNLRVHGLPLKDCRRCGGHGDMPDECESCGGQGGTPCLIHRQNDSDNSPNIFLRAIFRGYN